MSLGCLGNERLIPGIGIGLLTPFWVWKFLCLMNILFCQERLWHAFEWQSATHIYLCKILLYFNKDVHSSVNVGGWRLIWQNREVLTLINHSEWSQSNLMVQNVLLVRASIILGASSSGFIPDNPAAFKGDLANYPGHSGEQELGTSKTFQWIQKVTKKS